MARPLPYLERQRRGDTGPHANGALDCEVATDFPQDRTADREPQTASVRLGREERLGYTAQVLRGNATSVVGDRQLDECRRLARANAMCPPSPVASRAFVSRFRSSCSRSLWAHPTEERSAGTSSDRPMPRRPIPSLRIAATCLTAVGMWPCRVLRAEPRAKESMPPKIRRQTCSDWCTRSRSSPNTTGSTGPCRTSLCICCTRGTMEPSALFTSWATLRASSAIACFRSAVRTRARSASAHRRFSMAAAACDRKRSTRSAS